MKTFIEYLSYGKKKDEAPILYVNWTAKDTDSVHWVADGPIGKSMSPPAKTARGR